MMKIKVNTVATLVNGNLRDAKKVSVTGAAGLQEWFKQLPECKVYITAYGSLPS